MNKLIFIVFFLLPNLAAGQFFKDSSDVLTEDNIYEEDGDFGVPTSRDLDKRTKKLQKQIKELELRVQHLESQGKATALQFYICNLKAGLAGSYKAKAETKDKAREKVIKKCQKASGNSALCHPSNIRCSQR